MSDKTIFLKKVLEKRRYSREEENKIIGAELRDRRISLSRTLVSLSYKICSVSYLCKIENNKISPNRLYIRELCKRLDLEDDKVDELLRLTQTVLDVVKFFYDGNDALILDAYNRGKGLLNYRYKIVEMVYHISKKDLYTANCISDSLLKMASTMTDNDLQVFSLLYGILEFYNQNFTSSIEILRSIDVLKPRTKYITLLKEKYMLYCYLCLNDQHIMFMYNKVLNNLLANGLYEKIDELNYLFSLYLIRNNLLNDYKKIYLTINNIIYKRSLSLYTKLKLNPKIKIKDKWLKNVKPYFYYLGLIKKDYSKAKEEIEKLNDLSFDVDFNVIILKYLIISDPKEKLNFILDVAIPSLEKTKDGVAKKIFLDELYDLSMWFSKYKSFTESYGLLYYKR